MSNETITERKDGVTVSIELKRGTGTRDQDTIYVKGHYDDLRDAWDKRDRLQNLAEVHARDARAVDPERLPADETTEDLDNE